MSGLDKILEEIESDGRAKADAVMRRAEQEAQAIREKAMQEAQAAKAKRLEEAEKEAQRAHERVISAAELAAGQELLRVRQSLLADCFQKAHEAILFMPVYDYEELLCDLIARVADGGEEILLCQRDRDRISLLRFLVMVNNKLKLEGLDTPGLLMSDEVLEADGGFVLKKGDITVNCSLKMLLSEKREVLEGSLAAILCKE